ncbi:PspC domain-containing protein [Actinomadura namibiensis]|uniref:Phage shock protein PspC (Stress-responsive transcriptional regulator) n=1 Tax=Actinomadura namibiensis TaxID=182080 RepID=A0A7W3QPB2_ACTNM|nr:PspC domain-containing protein [Actinomadura namibiensis]MBA8954490.1 phage shock protein PspC (stress-responsive transcriptional regulator) [Actinomadura namibiensis]
MAEQQVPTQVSPPRLSLAPEGRMIAGVCTGLGRHTGIDPVVYRVGFALLTLAHGQGILLYIAAAVLMPPRPEAYSPVEQLLRRWFDAAGALSILGALLSVGVLGSLVGAGLSTDAVGAVTVLGLVLLVAHARGANFVGLARSLPERLQGHPLQDPPAAPPATTPPATAPPATTGPGTPPSPGVPLDKGPGVAAASGLAPGMVDLASLRSRPAPPVDDLPEPPLAPCAPAVARRPGRSPLTPITVLAALGAGAAATVPAAAHPFPYSSMVVLGTALAVIGGGMLLGGWFRVRGLAGIGVILTFTLLAYTAVAEMPSGSRHGDVEWRPMETSPARQDYRLGLGSGRLDLTALPVRPGQRAQVNAELLAGALVVTVPRAARVELDAKVRFGDLTVAGRVLGGPNARDTRVLEPEGDVANPPVIALRIRGKIGDVEVRRG